ncbi:tubulin domain-containing protein [Tirmania nivea]|nr:tubulin domain-containing protein [Tirmania nivea]
MHETVTLQLGHCANYVATHFWNTQQSYFTYGEDTEPTPIDHDVHFRAGIGAGGIETYTPRALIYDLKGGFGTMKKVNALYDMDEGQTNKNRAAIWNDNIIVQKEPEIEVHPYITSLELGTEPPPLTTDTVRYWSDFNTLYYHPRSIVQLYQYAVNSTLSPFENYTDGRELFNSIDKEYDVLDRDIRYFAEECDQMQGIQIFTTTDDGWGGFASEYALALRDEYPKTELWTWSFERGEKVPMEKSIPRTVALANALSALMPLSSIYVPLVSPPINVPKFIEMDPTSQWHKSALLSTAMETVTLQTRMKDKALGAKLADLSATLNPSGFRNIGLVSMTLPTDSTPAGSHNGSMTTIDSAPKPHLVDLSWTGKSSEKRLFSIVKVSRGTMQVDSTPSISESSMLQVIPQRLVLSCSGSVFDAPFHTKLAYPILDSFPNIFAGRKGSLPVVSSLRTSSAATETLRRVRDTVLRYAPLDDREDLYNELSGFLSVYEEGWDSGSDSGEDD